MASRSYFEDVERIKREVLLLASRAKPRVIIDVGVGESTRDLLSKGMGVVVAVDVNCSRLKDLYRDVDLSSSGGVLMPVCCDVVRLPLRRGSADLAVLHFVLHEIDPRLHPSVLSVLKGVSRHVLIAEPTPRGDEPYREISEVWRCAMRSVGRFEEYREPEYWLRLLGQLNFRVLEVKTVSWEEPVPREVLKALVNAWIAEWRRLGVPQEFIDRLEVLQEGAGEFRWSDILAVLASST